MGLGTLTLAPLAILASGMVCYRFPATATIAAFLLTGTYGSLRAFTGASGAALIDVLLVGLWSSLLITRLIRRQVRQQFVWPAMVVVAVYLGLTLLAVITSPDIYPAFLSFRLSGWYVLVVILIAYSGWQRPVYDNIARGFIVVGLLVGAYATLRWVIGPTGAEQNLALQVAGGYNFVEGTLRVFGSFHGGHQLGFWAGSVAPFCLGAALGWSGRWRALAGLALLFLVFAVLVSEVRAGFVGMVVGSAVVLGLFQLARSMPGLHLGRTAVAAATCIAVVSGGLLFTAGATDRLDRYTNIFNRDEDRAFVNRSLKWEEAIEDIQDHPFGQGVGSASTNPAIRPPFVSIANLALDNTYLKIAFEQGFVVMILFVIAVLLLFIQLAIGAIRTPDPMAAAMGMGAAGSLISAAATFYTGTLFEDVTALGPWMIVGLGAAFLIEAQSRSRNPRNG